MAEFMNGGVYRKAGGRLLARGGWQMTNDDELWRGAKCFGDFFAFSIFAAPTSRTSRRAGRVADPELPARRAREHAVHACADAKFRYPQRRGKSACHARCPRPSLCR